MLKKRASLIIFLVPVFAAQAMTFTLGGILSISSVNGSCAVGDFLSFSISSTLAATNDDGSGIAWSVFVVYDAYGTAIGTAPAGYGVGTGGTLPGFTAIMLDAARHAHSA